MKTVILISGNILIACSGFVQQQIGRIHPLHLNQQLIPSDTREKKEHLLKLLSKVQRSVPTPKKLTEEILSSVRLLEPLCPTNEDDVLEKIGGKWELIWTAQDTTTPESRRSNILKYINPLENQSYSNRPVDDELIANLSVVKGRSNPVLPQFLQNKLEDMNILAKENSLTKNEVISSQFVDLKKQRVRNLVSFNVNNPFRFEKSQSSSLRGVVTVDIIFKPNSYDQRKIDVKFSECRIKISSMDINIPLGFVGPTGWIRTSYIDDTLRITRGHKGSVFILSRNM